MARFTLLRATVVAGCLLSSMPALLSAQVGANDAALFKSAFQSSNYDPSGHFAGAAVDGNTDGNYYNGSITHTYADYQGWWYVDLGANYDISSITLWNRTDCCGSRLGNFFVSVLASGTLTPESYTAPTVWQTYQLGSLGTTGMYAPPAGTIGQFVKVQFDHADYLQLAEVDVEGTIATTTTPEPSSLALLGTGLAAMMLRRRRRQA